MMKSIIISLTVILAVAYAIDESKVLQEWYKFRTKFGKTYRSPLEARKRLSIFKSNLELIEAHNELFKNGQTTFTMGTNQFADWTRAEFKNYVTKGLLNSTSRHGEVFRKNPNFVAPESVDWRKEGIVTPVKDQGDCGSCWAFSSTGSLEGQYARKYNKLVSLSEQNLIDCSKNGNEGCDGGIMTRAFDYVKENGIDSEDDYPYLVRDATCRDKEFTPVTKLSGYVNIPSGDEDALTEAIATQGPISVAVDATSFGFSYYEGGIYTGYCTNYNLNHAIPAVGFGSENGQEYYIVKNSWGLNWGEEGYIRIARNYDDQCGIAVDAVYPIL